MRHMFLLENKHTIMKMKVKFFEEKIQIQKNRYISSPLTGNCLPRHTFVSWHSV